MLLLLRLCILAVCEGTWGGMPCYMEARAEGYQRGLEEDFHGGAQQVNEQIEHHLLHVHFDGISGAAPFI